MTIWVDAQVSPRTARWIAANFPVAASPLRDLGLRDAGDEEIFAAARIADAIVLTKDSDFVRLLEQQGICCSSGSACTTGSIHASHVLKAMGFGDDRARASLRFSFSRFNTRAEVEKTLEVLPGIIGKLRRVAVAA